MSLRAACGCSNTFRASFDFIHIFTIIVKFSRAHWIIFIVNKRTDDKNDVRCSVPAFSTENQSYFRPWIHSYFDNVMTKFMINNRTDT